MTTLPTSFIEQINDIIQDENPFAKPPYVNAKDIWGNEFLDVESINAHASDAVFQALKQIRAGLYSTTSIAITAQDGTGKTHIISRIRHRLQSQGGALFIYANKYGDIHQIKQGFQAILADSLRNIGSQQVRQWQELATAMANQALKAVNPNNNTFSAKELVEKLKQFEKGKPEEFKKWMNKLTKAYCQIKEVKNPDIVRGIFWTLSNEQVLYAVNWLSGQELAQFKANELGLPTDNKSFDSVLQILDLISEYYELVICFDELDNPEYDPDTGFTRAQVVAGLIKELFENIKRGVILSVMMPAVWSNKVKSLPGGVYNKLSAQGSPLELKYMDGNYIVDLVNLWLTEFYKAKHLNPPHSLYPFTEKQLRDLAQEKPTVREVLKWCRDNCRPGVEPLNPVEEAFNAEMKEDIGNYLDDNFLLADAIFFGFQALIGQTVERVTVEEVTNKVKSNRTDRHINFKIIGKENGNPVKIGVAVLQYAGGHALGTGLSKLKDYTTFDLTRGCLVRSKDKKIGSYLEKTHLIPLIKEKAGEYVELKEDEIKPLIAIRSVHQKREVDYKEVSEEEIFKFISEKGAENLLGASNPLLKDILSDPSYQIPTDLIQDVPVVSEELMMDDISDSDNLEERLDFLVSQLN